MPENDELKKLPEPDLKKGFGDSVEYNPDQAKRQLQDLPLPPKKDKQ
ncbi:hypothetical protein [Alicyclobacillus fastidiosus]|uniref:YfhE family protein n=1 Tax=Alicyclobacillus fastidiosus TaxID=392011 RepID=A0ABV5AL11_9BACL